MSLGLYNPPFRTICFNELRKYLGTDPLLFLVPTGPYQVSDKVGTNARTTGTVLLVEIHLPTGRKSFRGTGLT